MKRAYAALAATLLVLFAGSVVSTSVKAAPAQQAPAAKEAQEIFQNQCAFCHSEHGEGSEVGLSLNVVDLRSAKVQKQSDAALKQILMDGKENMPAFGKSFSDETLNELIHIVRTFDKGSTSHQRARQKDH